MTEPAPRISVVIPTHRRENRLAFALEALARQTLSPEDYEVIVARPPDSPGPHAAAPDGLALRSVEAPRLGMSAQRNAGWRAARSGLVAFTDDDCRPTADWLEKLLGGAGGDHVVVQGRTEPDPEEVHLLYGLARSKRELGPNQWFATCNIAYPRELLERVGGFDEAFQLAGEDTDLGLRARQANGELAYVDDALVWHAVHSLTFAQALREARRHRDVPRLVARHPDQRRELTARFFYNETHAAVASLAIGLLVARRSRALAALAAMPYLHRYARMLWRSGPVTPRRAARHLAQLPLELAVDAAQVVASLAGSRRHRRLVV